MATPMQRLVNAQHVHSPRPPYSVAGEHVPMANSLTIKDPLLVGLGAGIGSLAASAPVICALAVAVFSGLVIWTLQSRKR